MSIYKQIISYWEFKDQSPNSVDTDKMAHDEPSYLDQHWLQI